MSIIGSNILAGASGQAGGGGAYEISRSLRFNAGDSAYLSRTPASAGNRKKFTYSVWTKLAAIGTLQAFISARSDDNNRTTFFYQDSQLKFQNIISGSSATLNTSAVFRDPSAWYHILLSVDTDQGTSGNRVKIYVNGVEQALSGSYPGSGDSTQINNNVTHGIGRIEYQSPSPTGYFDGYMADPHLIDGIAADPSSFTDTDATTGQLVPKAYTGSYGTNGFRLAFDSYATTAALGTDTSSNGNTWTVNNLAVTGLATSTTGNISLGSTARNFYFKGLVGHQIGCSSGNHVWDSSDGASWTYRGLGSTPVTLTSTYLLLSGNTNVSFTNTNSDLVTYWDLGLSVGVPNGVGTTYTWNVNAFGAENIDSLVDTPTNGSQVDTGAGGEVVGNYATLNPLDKGTSQTLSNGNLDPTTASTIDNNCPSTIGVSSGKWYFELTINNIGTTGGGEYAIGLGKDLARNIVIGDNATSWAYASNGNIRTSSANSSYGSSYTTGDVLGAAFDADNGTLTFYKNGISQGTAATGISSGPYFFLVGTYGDTSSRSANFGQRAFAYPLSGFKALCTTNLPEPTIADGSTAMDVALYTGNGTTTGDTQTISGLSFSPDLVWIKARSTTTWNILVDTVRGVNKTIYSNDANQEEATTNVFNAFNSDGFQVAFNSSYSAVFTNSNSQTYAAWCWDAGSSTVTNTQGSITSQVRANASAGFSVVTFTAQSSGSGTIGHGLGVTPEFVIVKSRTGAYSWIVWHKSLTSAAYSLVLNTTAAESTGIDAWANTLPTSSVFSLGSSYAGASNSVAYCFAPVAGYSSFGSYTGNGSTDGPFVYTGGFKPKWVMIKRSDSTGSWIIWDTSRTPYNLAENALEANSSNAESSGWQIDLLSNGFKSRNVGTQYNASGGTYVWAAFAENPFQYARAR
jgi:hypothetical protein